MKRLVLELLYTEITSWKHDKLLIPDNDLGKPCIWILSRSLIDKSRFNSGLRVSTEMNSSHLKCRRWKGKLGYRYTSASRTQSQLNFWDLAWDSYLGFKIFLKYTTCVWKVLLNTQDYLVYHWLESWYAACLCYFFLKHVFLKKINTLDYSPN